MSALRRVVLDVEYDLQVRVEGDDISLRQDGVIEAWRTEYQTLLSAERTGVSWIEWRNDRITQAAVSWVLLTVFARYCEDNHLVTHRWISGPTDDERGHALDTRTAYFRAHPEHTDRDWLTSIAHHFARYPATAGLVDSYAPMWQVAPSGDAARALLEFWWDKDDTGSHKWVFTGIDTRFLGDVYENLSAAARTLYALRQTPEFVEEFILDRTLEPAMNDRPLDGFTMIDPTCGSGHFLLGAFHRLHTRWQHHAPALGNRELVQKALDAVHGVDINPFAVAIARFRLLIAAITAAGDTNLEQPLGYTTHLAAGDSLLWGSPQQALSPDLLTFGATDDIHDPDTNPIENTDALFRILQREHDAVVGNPPYITVKDKALNALYRQLYTTPHRQYALTVPFMELFFRLARDGRDGRTPAGWVGQITSNSFMKREFGTKLIEQFLPAIDLKEIIDTSGAYIPGHGTPTVIMVGRNRPPTGDSIRTTLGKRGEPGKPDQARAGLVWNSIASSIDLNKHEDIYTSVRKSPRALFAKHPWSLSGGMAQSVAAKYLSNSQLLASAVRSIGLVTTSGEDDAFGRARSCLNRYALPIQAGPGIKFVEAAGGENVRDYSVNLSEVSIWPYSKEFERQLNTAEEKELWPNRRLLEQRKIFGIPIEKNDRIEWWQYREAYVDKLSSPLLIVWPVLTTHNHFAITEELVAFNRSAPVIALHPGASRTDYLRLLGLLNTSSACFWLKQNSHNKGRPGAEQAGADEEWEQRFEFTVTTLKDFPLPTELPLVRSQRLDELSRHAAAVTPTAVAKVKAPLRAVLEVAQRDFQRIRGLMIAEQEELDWEYYRIFGLIDEDLTYTGDVPSITLGERSFEVGLARQIHEGVATSTWFSHWNHRSTPVTEIPAHLPADYQALLQRRLDAIATNPHIELLERPEYKRRWATEPWGKQVAAAQRDWLLDRLENRDLWYDRDGRPTPRSIAQLADLMDHDPTYRDVLTTWAGNPDITTTTALTTLLDTEHVPYLAAHRYKPTGLDKRQAWEHTWDLQRREDAGEHLDTPIPVPPKYKPTDFRKTSYWSHRGKLDVPKERVISYPDASRGTDPTLLLGWAGWDHGDQALALATLTTERTDDGWTADQLIPLIAGLHELAPWCRQWHNTIDPDYGQSLADTIDEELHTHLTTHHLTTTDLTTWQPTPTTRGRRTKKATT
ncbi:DNA methylase [Rhodococcoides trifolii]|uniref:site-specific DNA-methyltransferase (adenine-specific) n=1 Tax=Rhodococcoides trifolii TaxID=908250 RepID=A0A917CV46_9NOCA|nr:DNA methylase [Rhodococcus trifolii]